MKFLIPFTFLIGALASPVAYESGDLEARNTIHARQTANEYTRGGCKRVVMVYARGSTETGNLGTLGPTIQRGLSSDFNRDFAMEGIDYPADLAGNFQPDGASASGINEMTQLLRDIASKCPNTRIAAGGYSQGSALAAKAIQNVNSGVKDKIDAVVFFGYTKNQQNRGGIPGFPSNKLKVFCAFGDMVCTGTLTITLAHLGYAVNVNEAVRFITSKIKR